MGVSSIPAGWEAKQVSGYHRRKFSETLVSEPPFGYFRAGPKVPRPQAKQPLNQQKRTADHSAIRFSYFFSKSSIASSKSLVLGTLVFFESSLNGSTSLLSSEEINLVRFTSLGSAKSLTTLHI